MTDLFESLNSLFRHQRVEDPPYPVVLHRFLSSDPDYAQVAKELGRDIRDSAMVFEVWRAVVPQLSKAPFLYYPAPGKPGEEAELVKVIMQRENLNRADAEEVLEVMVMCGLAYSLAEYYGVEIDDEV